MASALRSISSTVSNIGRKLNGSFNRLPNPSFDTFKFLKPLNIPLEWDPKTIERTSGYTISSATKLRGVDDLGSEDFIIFIVGPVGAGKGTFIQKATGLDWDVSHSLVSKTVQVSAVRVEFTDGVRLVLVDTPGFDDTYKSDSRVLKPIVGWKNKILQVGLKIFGMLYLHKIDDNRMNGTPRKSLKLFRTVCGDEISGHGGRIIPTTTMWAESENARDPDELMFQRRQDDLDRIFWNDLLLEGSTSQRFRGTQESAWRILDGLLASAPRRQVDESRALHATPNGLDSYGESGPLPQMQKRNPPIA